MDHLDGLDGTLSCDRFSAYAKFSSETTGSIDLSYCWAHTRRDFIAVEKKYPEHKDWSDGKLDAIGYLYHLHHIRRAAYRADPNGGDFHLFDEVFKEAALGFKELCEEECKSLSPGDPGHLALENIGVYWQGLSAVIADPQLDMDSNAAERAIRGPVVGRKNYWGNIAEWSGHFSMMMFSIFQTLLLWGINPRT